MSRCRNIAEHFYFTDVRSILTYVFIVLFYCFAIYPTADAGQNKLQTKKLKIYHSGTQPGHYLEWKNKPILLIGDSVTQGWMECGFNFRQEAYVDALAARNMNLLMIWSYIGTNANIQKNDSRIGYDSPEIWPWSGSIDQRNLNLLEFNQAYFNRLKELVAYANEKNILVLIIVHDGGVKWRFDQHPFNAMNGNGPLTEGRQYVELHDYSKEMPKKLDTSMSRRQQNQYLQERFCNKLISELSSFPNVIYEMFNEGNQYNANLRNRHEQHFLSFFRARCDNLLMTNTDHIFGDNPHHDNKVDMITLHGDWINRFDDFWFGFTAMPPKPYLLSEPVPDWKGSWNFLSTIRRSVWEVTLAGANWVSQNDTSFGWDTNAKMASKSGLRDLSYDYAGYCSRFFNNSGINFYEMKPNGKLSSTGICLARRGIEYVVYAPKGGQFTVDLAEASYPLKAKWYNPRTGNFLGPTVIKGGKITIFRTPDEKDWVLYITTDNKNKIDSILN